MTITRDEWAAKSAELNGPCVSVGLKAGESEADIIRRAEEARQKGRSQQRVKLNPHAKPVEFKVKREVELLEKLKAALLSRQRAVDADGVEPPVLQSLARNIRKEAQVGSKTGTRGAHSPKLMELRIHVLLLTVYESRVSVNRAIGLLVESHEGLTAGTLRLAYNNYARPDEMAYKPYARTK